MQVFVCFYNVYKMKRSESVPSSKKKKRVNLNLGLPLKCWWTGECWPQLLCSWPSCQGMGHWLSLSSSHFHFCRSGMADLSRPSAKGYPLSALTHFYLLHSTVIFPFLSVVLGSSSLIFFIWFNFFALGNTWSQTSWPLVWKRLRLVKHTRVLSS